MGERTTVRVPAGRAGLRADAFLALAFPTVSRTRLLQKVQQGEALLNGRRFATSARVREGDEIEIAWRGAAPASAPAPGLAPAVLETRLPILHEDADLLAVDKPAGMDCHPAGGVQQGTVIQIVRARLAADTERCLAAGERDRYPTLANRLDRFTSGVVLVARHHAALVSLQGQRERGEIEKRYLAVVKGQLTADEGAIDLALGPDPASRISIKMAPRAEEAGGLRCRTEYRVVQRLPGHTLVRATTRTGRQHQVRAHFAAIGHPVWGDLIYRDESLFLRYLESGGEPDPSLPPRHLLHAESVVLRQPGSGELLKLIAAVPADFEALVSRLSAR